MPLSLYELATSRAIERSVDSGSETLKWIAMYSTDQNAVAAALLLVAPKVYDTLRRTKYSCTPLGAGVWMCDVEYSWSADTQTDTPDDQKDPTDDTNLGPESSFDVTAGSCHVTQSLLTNYRWKPGKVTDPAPNTGDATAYGNNATVTSASGFSSVLTLDGYTGAVGDVGKYLYVSPRFGPGTWKTGRYLITAQAGATVTVTGLPARVSTANGVWVISSELNVGTAANVKQAVGTTRDGVEGTDIYFPKFEFTWSVQRFPVTLPYLRQLRSLVAKTNNATWRGFERGELLYLGATGQSQPGNVWTIAHKFAAGENLYAVPVSPTLVMPQKNAWEYLWCTYGYDTDNRVIYNVPTGAYVEQMYREADFTLIGMGK